MVVWEGEPPFRMVGVGRTRILFKGEEGGFLQDTGGTTVSPGATKYREENGAMSLMTAPTSTIILNSPPHTSGFISQTQYQATFHFYGFYRI